MSNFPASCFIVGKFVGFHPEQRVNDDFFKQNFAIDTEEKFNNIKVFEAHRTATTDHIAQLKNFKNGDLVKVNFNVRSNKTTDGKWFTNVTAWKIQSFVPQDTADFKQPESSTNALPTSADEPPITAPENIDPLPF